MARQLTYYTQKLDVNLSNCFELCILFPSLHISSHLFGEASSSEQPYWALRRLINKFLSPDPGQRFVVSPKLWNPKYPKKLQEIQRNPKKFVKVTAGPKDWRGSLHSLNTAVFMHHVLVNDYDHYDNVQKRQFWHLRNSSLRIFDAVSSWSVQSV